MKTVLIGGVLVVGALLGAGTANADISPVEICDRLDQNPAKGTITGIAMEELTSGMSSDDTAMEFVLAAYTCPTHRALIVQTMEEYAAGDVL